MLSSIFARTMSLLLLAVCTFTIRAGDPVVHLKGKTGPGAGKKIVLISGDEEYRSEETIPALGKILAERHGFDCTLLFAIDPRDGTINPNIRNNIPGLENLKNADLMVIFTRFRDLPDAQMKHVVEYVESGKPIVGLRTSTHAFDTNAKSSYARYNWKNKDWPGGFGKQVLGETWISHHGMHGIQSTKGIFVPEERGHPILKGIADGSIWGPTDVYGVVMPLPGDSKPLVLGQVLNGMKQTDSPAGDKYNKKMMPIAWVKTFQAGPNKPVGRAFTTTMGAAQDFENEPFRRLLVNACYWALKLEDSIPESSDVQLVGEFKPSPFKFGGFIPGIDPQVHAQKK